MQFANHIHRQLTFSGKTFGPGDRHGGLTNHIRKELAELGAPPDDLEQAVLDRDNDRALRIVRERQMRRGQLEERGDPEEWVDVVLLAIDGLWRSLRARYGCITDEELSELAYEMIEAKQTKNEKRVWPDWRTMSADHAIEHERGIHD